MSNYYQMAGASGMSLAELVARAKAKRAMRQQQANPGAVPTDTQGGPQQVSIPGEAPITAQPVAGQRPQYGVTVGTPQIQQQPQVSIGMPQRQITTQPITAQIPAQQTNPQASMDPRAARVRALMGQGMSYEQAMTAVQQG